MTYREKLEEICEKVEILPSGEYRAYLTSTSFLASAGTEDCDEETHWEGLYAAVSKIEGINDHLV